MHQGKRTKFLLYSSVFVAATLLVVALFSLYFSDKTLTIKKQELILAQKYQRLQQQIAQKEAEYRKLSDDIEEIKHQVGLSGTNKTQDIRTLLQKCTPQIRKMLLENIPRGYPSKTRRVTSEFGFRMHPIYHEERFHHGIDFGGATGTPVVATADGIVIYAGFSKGGYGNVVIIAHNFGFQTLYGHMQSDLAVKTGDFVKKGTCIGYLGNSGRSTGPHLHYEIKYLRNSVDPASFLTASQESFDRLLEKSTNVNWQAVIAAITTSYRKFTSL